ncbi:hypothetical protein GS481_02985 [Rhodococcus hoagii]|nr:hypothetical protein [Prescottella equi]
MLVDDAAAVRVRVGAHDVVDVGADLGIVVGGGDSVDDVGDRVWFGRRRLWRGHGGGVARDQGFDRGVGLPLGHSGVEQLL